MFDRKTKRYLVIQWVLFFCLSFAVGVMMTELGFTIEAGYLWQRQIVIWAFFPLMPALITYRLYRKNKRQ